MMSTRFSWIKSRQRPCQCLDQVPQQQGFENRAAKGMNRETFKPIPKHSLVEAQWDHDMKTIRLRQYDTEATVAEQMVAFSLSLEKSRRRRGSPSKEKCILTGY